MTDADVIKKINRAKEISDLKAEFEDLRNSDPDFELQYDESEFDMWLEDNNIEL